MFCIKCGEKIEEGTKFCIKCGTPVNASSVPNTPPTAGGFGGVTPEQMRVNTAQGIANQAMAETQTSYREPPKTVLPQQQTVPPSLAAQYVRSPGNNLLIAMIVLSIVTSVLSGLVIMNFSDICLTLADWFIYILLAVALVQGYVYPSSFLKISAFIGLALKGSQCVWDFIDYDYWRITCLAMSIQYLIFAIIFLVSAVQLLKKSARSGK